MKTDNSKHSGPMITGGTTLLVIFAVLALMLLDVLPMVSTIQEKHRADQVASAYHNYYEADTEANEILAQIRTGNVPQDVISKGDIYSYQVAVSDTQLLAVEVKVDDGAYEILRWQTVSTVDWVPDESLNLYTGEN